MIEGRLVPSSISGRYAIDDPNAGRGLSLWDIVEIYLNGQWIRGSIEHALIYAIEGHNVKRGYYFVASNGGICGLCVGMQVRIPE